jgi:uncharacterized protein YoaH (UPF0181 family)
MNEETRHRLAFDLYVKLGASRSLEALQAALVDDPSLIQRGRAPTRSTIESWSSAFRWQDRLRDLEREAVAQDHEELVQLLRQMNARHGKEGLALQQKGIERLNTLTPTDMSAADAIRAVSEGVRLERLAHNVPTDHVLQEGVMLNGHVELRSFSNEELRRLAELAERHADGAGEEDS